MAKLDWKRGKFVDAMANKPIVQVIMLCLHAERPKKMSVALFVKWAENLIFPKDSIVESKVVDMMDESYATAVELYLTYHPTTKKIKYRLGKMAPYVTIKRPDLRLSKFDSEELGILKALGVGLEAETKKDDDED